MMMMKKNKKVLMYGKKPVRNDWHLYQQKRRQSQKSIQIFLYFYPRH